MELLTQKILIFYLWINIARALQKAKVHLSSFINYYYQNHMVSRTICGHLHDACAHYLLTCTEQRSSCLHITREHLWLCSFMQAGTGLHSLKSSLLTCRVLPTLLNALNYLHVFWCVYFKNPATNYCDSWITTYLLLASLYYFLSFYSLPI